MKVSLAASLAFHAAILIAALVVLPAPKQEAKPVEAITVDISNISDSNKLMAMSKDAPKPVEKAAPKKAQVNKKADPTLEVAEKEITNAKQAAAKPPEPEKKPEEVKKEEPKKEEVKKDEPKPLDPDPLKDLIKDTLADDAAAKAAEQKKIEEQKKAEEKKKADEKKKAEEKKKLAEAKKKAEEKKKQQKLDVAKLEDMLNDDALLNKENEKKTTTASEATDDGSPAQGEKNLQGKDQSLSATAISAFVQRIRDCWNIPPGAQEGNVTVKIRIQINPDGTIAGTPQVLNGPGDFLFETTARSTVAAIMECQNYDFLPQDQYDVWKDLILNFNPNMFGASAETQ